jgi:hypothetical protein
MRIRRRFQILAIVALSGALASVNMTTATAASGTVRATPADGTGRQPAAATGLIRYSAQNPSARHMVLTGKKTSSGGCLFQLSGNTGMPSLYTETAYDPNTCLSFIDVTRAASALPASGGKSPARQASSATGSGQGGRSIGAGHASGKTLAAALATCTDPNRDTHHSYSHSACIHSWFHDPPGIHVSDVTNEVQWNPGSGCATHGSSYASGYLQWYTTTGWQLYHNHFLDSFNCSGVTSDYIDPSRSDNAGAIFINGIFCAATVTYTYYASQITGFSNGTYTWQVDWSKTGLCQNLLTFQASAS